MKNMLKNKNSRTDLVTYLIVIAAFPVSYTHLTLPTITAV